MTMRHVTEADKMRELVDAGDACVRCHGDIGPMVPYDVGPHGQRFIHSECVEVDIDAMEASANAATPPPWRIGHTPHEVFAVNKIVAEGVRPNDARFMVRARTDVLVLCNYVRELRRKLSPPEPPASATHATRASEATHVTCPYCGKCGRGMMFVDREIDAPHATVTVRLPPNWMWSGSKSEPQIICRECGVAWGNGRAVPMVDAALRAENKELRDVGNIALARVEEQKAELAALHLRHEKAALGWAEERVKLNRAQARIAELEEDLRHEARRRDV